MANVIDRTPRESETRVKAERAQSWKPAHDLPVPVPQDGYVFHWKRVSMAGQADPANMAKARREGWEPCKAEDHPEMVSDFAAFGLKPEGLIEIGGLVLCKSTVENAVARKQYYEQQTNAQTQAVDQNFMRENDPRMPLFKEGKTRVSFGSGS